VTVLERVELANHAAPRSDGQLGAFDFQRWIEKWRDRPDVRILIAADSTHALAVVRETA
jgi:hypothetical protein